jgi:hypothetical protein
MATRVAETCLRLICNKIAFTIPRALVSLFKKLCTSYWVRLVWGTATSRKVAGFIPDGDNKVFHSGRTIALGLTQPLTPGIFPRGKGDRCLGLTTLPHSQDNCFEVWELQPPRTLRACPGLYKHCCSFIHLTNALHLKCMKVLKFLYMFFVSNVSEAKNVI